MKELLLSLFSSASAIVVPDVPVVPVPEGILESIGAVPVVAAGTSDWTVPGGDGDVDVAGGSDVEGEAGDDTEPVSVCADVTEAESINTIIRIAKDLIVFQPPCH